VSFVPGTVLHSSDFLQVGEFVVVIISRYELVLDCAGGLPTYSLPCGPSVENNPGAFRNYLFFWLTDVHREAIDDQCLILSVEELPPSSGDFARSASGSAAAGSEGVDNLSNSTGLCAWTAKLRFDNSESRELAMELLLSRR